MRPEGRPSRLAHIAKCAMYAPPGRGGCPSQPTVGNEAGMCPAINDLTNHAPIAHWSAPLWCFCAPMRPTVAARTHRKMRDVCATRLGRMSVSADCRKLAGMCPGINGFTNYAPIADWAKVKSWSSTGSAESPAFETLRLFSAETSHRPQSLQAAEFWKATLGHPLSRLWLRNRRDISSASGQSKLRGKAADGRIGTEPVEGQPFTTMLPSIPAWTQAVCGARNE